MGKQVAVDNGPIWASTTSLSISLYIYRPSSSPDRFHNVTSWEERHKNKNNKNLYFPLDRLFFYKKVTSIQFTKARFPGKKPRHGSQSRGEIGMNPSPFLANLNSCVPRVHSDFPQFISGTGEEGGKEKIVTPPSLSLPFPFQAFMAKSAFNLGKEGES